MENDYNNYDSYNNQGNQSNQNSSNNQYNDKSYKREIHNHEFQSSVDYEKDEEGMEHSHRIVGITGPAIRYGQSHVHKINVLTDTSGGHYHETRDTTGPALYLNSEKHVHLLMGITTYDDGHKHKYYFTTLIEEPTNVSENGKR